MSDETTRFDPKLLEGIAYFEQMLQVMPDDRTTLEFLCVAYEQTGDEAKRRRAFIRLANVLLKEGDLDSARMLVERLQGFEEADAQAAVLRIRAATGYVPEVDVSAEGGRAGDAVGDFAALVRPAIAAETALVRRLRESKILDDETGSFVERHLAELAGQSGCFLVSASAILEKENPALSETVVAWMADTAGTPPIPLEIFDGVRELRSRLPEPLVRVYGVLPFARLGSELLVACLNPLDDELRRQVVQAADGPCRFYVAHPRTMEEALERLFAEGPSEAGEAS